MSRSPTFLVTKIPPPVLMVSLAVCMWLVAQTLPYLTLKFPFNDIVAIAFSVLGLTLNIYPKLLFHRAGTTVNPMQPHSTTNLVTTNIYRYTRNPMYVGHAFILLGWAIHLQHALTYLAVPAYMLFISRFQIQPEERELAARFVQDYADYCKTVRRWI